MRWMLLLLPYKHGKYYKKILHNLNLLIVMDFFVIFAMRYLTIDMVIYMALFYQPS